MGTSMTALYLGPPYPQRQAGPSVHRAHTSSPYNLLFVLSECNSNSLSLKNIRGDHPCIGVELAHTRNWLHIHLIPIWEEGKENSFVFIQISIAAVGKLLSSLECQKQSLWSWIRGRWRQPRALSRQLCNHGVKLTAYSQTERAHSLSQTAHPQILQARPKQNLFFSLV